jgi:hypothetical protein
MTVSPEHQRVLLIVGPVDPEARSQHCTAIILVSRAEDEITDILGLKTQLRNPLAT